jgi:hypothetical protein
MNTKICKHVSNSLRYWKLNLDHYTYMQGNGIIPLQSQLHYFLGSIKASSSNFECKFLIV